MAISKYNKNRTLVNHNDLLLTLGSDAIVCVDLAVIEVIRKLLINQGLWSSTYVKTYFDSGYERPTDVELEGIRAAIADFIDETGDNMSICADFNDTLIAINETLQNLVDKDSCGSDGPGSGGAGGEDDGQNTFVDDGSTTFPAGFANRAEYEVYKCQIANAIRQSIGDDAEYISLGSLVTLTTTILVGALLTPIPFDELIALVGFALSLLFQGILVSTANEITTAIEGTSGNVLVCALYDATDSEAARDALETWGDDNLGTVANGLFGYFVKWTNTNRLFEKNAIGENTVISGTAIDCDNCGETEWAIVSGTGTIRTDGIVFTMTSELVGGNYDVSIEAVVGRCDVDDCLTIVDWLPAGGAGQGWLGVAGYIWDAGNCPNRIRTINETFPAVNTHQMSSYALTRNIPFTIDFIIEPQTCP